MITVEHPSIRNALLSALGAGTVAFAIAAFVSFIDPLGLTFHRVTYPLCSVFAFGLGLLAFLRPGTSRAAATLLCMGLTLFFLVKTAWVLFLVPQGLILKELTSSGWYYSAVYVIAFIIPGIRYAKVMSYGFMIGIVALCLVYLGLHWRGPWTDVNHSVLQLAMANIAIPLMIRGFNAFKGFIAQSGAREEALQTLAETDPLTRLPNRLGCVKALDAAIGADEPFAVVFVDLDRFKAVNDTHGHEVGDALLRGVADRLRERVREHDVLSRIAGDEFVIILYHVDTEAKALAVIEQVASAFDVPFSCRDVRVKSSASMGFCLYPEHGTTPEELLSNADRAMYRVKRGGRDGVSGYELVVLAEDAIAEGQLELLYQPIFMADQLTPLAVEALLRWHHPTRGTLGGREALESLNNDGVVESFVMNAALRQFIAWRDAGYLPGGVAVNISVGMFRSPSFAGMVKHVLAVSRAHPGDLWLELPEATFADERAQPAITELHALGVQLVMDDFGAGDSSLRTLAHPALTAVKLDVAVTRQLGRSVRDLHRTAALLYGLIAGAQALDLSVVAEGVETAEAEDILRKAGVDAWQGYFYARPLEAREVAAALPRQVGVTPSEQSLN